MSFCSDSKARGDLYTLQWTRPGYTSRSSMPLGNGEYGMNFWVDQNGNLLFYISSTSSWDENARLLKLGRIRINLLPNPFLKAIESGNFRKILDLKSASIKLEAGYASAVVWIDANNPLITVEVRSKEPIKVSVGLELWRDKVRELEGYELESSYGLVGSPTPVYVYPDQILEDRDYIIWYHRNRRSIWQDNLRLQGLDCLIDRLADPLLNRTFGGLIKGEGLVKRSYAIMESASPSLHHLIYIVLHTSQSDSWKDEICSIASRYSYDDVEKRFESHCNWWKEFWDRSWIVVDGFDEAETVNRGYIFQRFMTACAGRGRFPIKFNGSIFTADWDYPLRPYDADFRRWGGLYWFQNTRLIYWPLLATGDFDLMMPFFDMYIDALELAEVRTRLYFGHEGAVFPETIYFWDTYAEKNYGWNRTGKELSYVENPYIRYYWQGNLELLAMGLDYFDFTEDTEFFRAKLLPLAKEILTFFDKHYPRDKNGRLLLKPAQALETWHEAVNPLPEIAGLMWVLDRLLSIKKEEDRRAIRGLVDDKQWSQWERLRGALPPIPMAESESGPVLSPAESVFGPIMNQENPQLYAVFPYRIYGVGRPGYDVALRTYNHRSFRGNLGWKQDGIWAALLAVKEDATYDVISRFSTKYPKARFDAFWGPNFDWIPDQDHGCAAMMALQFMLMQWDGRKILLFPSWPCDWDVDFRLACPYKTNITGRYRSGRLEYLFVDPEGRREDIKVIL